MNITIRGKQLTTRGIQNFVTLMSGETKQVCNFWLKSSDRKALDKEFQSLSTPEDYYHFAKKTFGLMQHIPEILGLVEYVEAIKPKYVCEIGTYEGGTNFLISQSIPSVREMIGVDLFVQHTTQLRHFCKPDRKVNYLNGSSYADATVKTVETLLGTNQLDFLFIDGDHRYEGVKNDFLAYRHLVRDGGIIAFHDIVPDHKTRYGKDTGMWAGDVPIFWERLKRNYEHKEFVQDREQDGLGIGALKYVRDNALPTDL